MQRLLMSVFAAAFLFTTPPAEAAPVLDAGVEESRQQDAAPPTNDGLGTSPSWTELRTIAGAAWSAVAKLAERL
jgi:hypothetical protein